MAVSIGTGTARRSTLFSARWVLAQFLSFEAVFVLFLYSNEIKVLLQPLPVDETVIFAADQHGHRCVDHQP